MTLMNMGRARTGRWRLQARRTLFGRQYIVLQIEVAQRIPPMPGKNPDEWEAEGHCIGRSRVWRDATADDLINDPVRGFGIKEVL